MEEITFQVQRDEESGSLVAWWDIRAGAVSLPKARICAIYKSRLRTRSLFISMKQCKILDMKLLVSLEPDETGMIVAECPSIPGCISQGATESEALQNIREAILGCIETRKANSMPLTVEVREVEVAV